MPSDTVVTGTDDIGNARYAALYEEIMNDVGKLAAVGKSYILLKPEVPLFIFSLKMKARPSAKTVGAVASTRSERDMVYVSITDEMYAPGIIKALWQKYGRDNVQQLDRMDISIKGAASSFEVDDLEVESNEQPVQEVLGALYRVLPEGIRNRETVSSDDVITVIATEERMTQDMKDLAMKIHNGMISGGEIDV